MTQWIIVLRMESGTEYAFSVFEKKFALVPVDPDTGAVRGALAWQTKLEASQYLKEQLKFMPDLKRVGKYELRETIEPH